MNVSADCYACGIPHPASIHVPTAFDDGTTFVDFGYCPACDGAPIHIPHNAACTVNDARIDRIANAALRAEIVHPFDDIGLGL